MQLNNYFNLLSDPRTKTWLLSDTPGPLFTILVTYLYFCLYAGPRFMRDRKPFQLKNVLIWYNAIQVALSIVLVWEVRKFNWFHLMGNKLWSFQYFFRALRVAGDNTTTSNANRWITPRIQLQCE